MIPKLNHISYSRYLKKKEKKEKKHEKDILYFQSNDSFEVSQLPIISTNMKVLSKSLRHVTFKFFLL